MFKYDIPYCKPGQLMLIYLDTPLNVSKKKSYLIEKMNDHRATMCEANNIWPAAQYKIIESSGSVIYIKNFLEGEKTVHKTPTNIETTNKTNYINKDGFMLIADENDIIITDEKLMRLIYDFIFINRLPITNSRQISVQLATFKPTSKDEFISLKGLGEKIYDKCGEVLLQFINDYCK